MNVHVTGAWTEERTRHAAKLWRDGLTASQIAAALGGISRNAVIGKATRNPDLFAPRRGVAPRIARPANVKQHAPKPKATAAIFRAPPKRVAAPPVTAPERPHGLFRHRDLSIDGATPIAFALIDRLQCSWPLTDFEDGDGPDMPCCGRPRRGGLAPDSAYCAEHAAVSRGAA
ncbi:GcrA family cell cycle regulator protein [Rhizobium etli 8C-3]|uniref:GcrA family cell cycle regulator protein n=1 Tax=Rhizobium etli 8C-3 TaxID=538025 RepID=A0A1L5P2D1_RHIET|nr:GcrA family cell cycle regulator [Rhizobium etli]APO74246.1 GcrA family cell cycle regulator protein [Rhizobium etli 8C-3]